MAFNSYEPKKGDIVFYNTYNASYKYNSVPGVIVEVFPSESEEIFDKVLVKWEDDDKSKRTELISAGLLGCYLNRIRSLEDTLRCFQRQDVYRHCLREMKSRVDNLCE